MFKARDFHYIFIAAYCLVTFGSYFTFVYPWLTNVLTVIALLLLPKFKYSFTRRNILIFLSLLILYTLTSITYNQGLKPLKYALFVPILALISRDEILKIYNYFIKIFIISTIPSLIILLLHIIGIQNILPSYIVDPGRPFIVYPGTVLQEIEMNTIMGITFYRISGIQGEPGGIGVLCIFILMAANLNLKSNTNRFILLLGLISFSLVFYILLILYYLLTTIFITSVKKTLKTTFLTVLLAIFIANTNLFNFYIQSRIENVDPETPVETQLRTKVSSIEFFQYFFHQDVEYIIFGRGAGANTDSSGYQGAGSISYMAYLYNFGMFNIFLLFTTMFFLIYNRRFPKESIIAFIIILGSFYQRPYIFNNGYFFLFIAIAYCIQFQTMTKKTVNPIFSSPNIKNHTFIYHK